GVAEVDHRLDGEGHPGAEAEAPAAAAVVVDVRGRVHVAADAVAAQLAHDAASGAARDLLDGGADVAEAGAVAHDGDAGVAAGARRLDDVARLGAGLADEEGGGGVAVEASEAGG